MRKKAFTEELRTASGVCARPASRNRHSRPAKIRSRAPKASAGRAFPPRQPGATAPQIHQPASRVVHDRFPSPFHRTARQPRRGPARGPAGVRPAGAGQPRPAAQPAALRLRRRDPARAGHRERPVRRQSGPASGRPGEARLEPIRIATFRFRPDKALLGGAGAPFRMHMFHPGFLFTRPVVVNVIRDGVSAPVPYSASLFDYGRNKLGALPVNLGFAGFRLHYPLNDPRVQDELISFLGASYFRFLGRKQRYGLSARGLAIGVGAKETEEFPELPGVLDRQQPRPSSTALSSMLCSTGRRSRARTSSSSIRLERDRGGRADAAVPTQADPAHGRRAADLDVLRRRERPALQR